MGFSRNGLEICNKISMHFKGSSVLSLGNPFISNETLFRSNFANETKQKIISLDRDIRSPYLFKEVYEVEKFNILDISEDEGADYIYDLNELISDQSILSQYDYLLDLGTQEHVFNNTNFLSNVFNLLKDNGKYIFELPANCELEHGFRQYSPTFFYDLCCANNNLSIEWLGLHSKECNLNVLPLYQKLDKNYSKIRSFNFNNLDSLGVNNGSLTGTSISLFNKLSTSVSVIGLIQKNESKELKFNSPQCLYRNFSLKEVLVKENNRKNISFNLKSIVKISILNFPLPALIKFKLISLISKIIVSVND